MRETKRVSQGQWQGYVMAGQSKGERRVRLALVPEEMRAAVEDHVRTAFSIKRGNHGN